MTSTTDTAGHPDVMEISDLTEGLLPPSRTADVRRHLDACELCADVLASLEEIRGLLGTLPGPSRMPDDVAERIDAALAAEALLNATALDGLDVGPDHVDATASSGPKGVASAETAPGVSDPDVDTHVSRETSVAGDRPSGRARTSTTGPGRKDRKRGGRRRAVVLGAVFSAAALGLGSVLVSSLTGSEPGTTAHQQSSSSDTFSKGGLEQQVADLLAKGQSSGSGSRTPDELNVESAPGNDRNRIFKQPPVQVPECVQNSIERTRTALASESGVYEGTKALLVVVPDTTNPARVTAYIVDATCVDQSSTTAKVLLQESYTRP
ncbi:anti-sigma factor family protein [Streptomyces cadmiisoli]|uniref:Zf-HC2 domain-containing protein n=1 Tax=Streptomyces cadmiisoli TaxID=2184053 RepID=A0A2Z4J0G1_9ACTN|nr:hypothetical protein [Streptomyces cadmiisoli]AWW38632.1 hypothetical protein DN051_19845 [Streptomyces cadmiisoli]